jgi:NAD(P)-dependent dehydrogenase (short-subunit alcohol dehydrogenase family)
LVSKICGPAVRGSTNLPEPGGNRRLERRKERSVADTDEARVLITGATDGLGRRVARDLAASGATVLLHGRDKEHAETTAHEIREETNNDKLRYYLADFSSLGEVRRLTEEVRADHDHLDVLVNNAGVFSRERAVSEDGHELTFAVNYLAPFLLTYLLVPLLRGSAPARVVNVASIGQSPVNFDDPMLERGYDGMRAYAQSKLALIMFTFDLAGQLEGTGVTVNCLHPATLMGTKMVFEAFGSASSDVQEGADATVYLAADPDLEEVTGRYFEGQREARAKEQAYNPEAKERLRTLSEELTGLRDS